LPSDDLLNAEFAAHTLDPAGAQQVMEHVLNDLRCRDSSGQ
jgi:hypothetical protein